MVELIIIALALYGLYSILVHWNSARTADRLLFEEQIEAFQNKYSGILLKFNPDSPGRYIVIRVDADGFYTYEFFTFGFQQERRLTELWRAGITASGDYLSPRKNHALEHVEFRK